MKRLRNYVLMAAGFAVLAMVVGVFSVGPAIAQAVRAALVSNVDDPGRIPYQASQTCSFSGTQQCIASFPLVPDRKRLVITHVSGDVSVSANVPGGALLLPELMAGSGRIMTFPATSQGSQLGNTVFVFNQSALLFYDAGQNPRSSVFLAVTPDQFSGGLFVLSGYMLDCSTGPCAAIAP